MRLNPLPFLLLLLLPLACSAATFYVSPSGNDNNGGSAASPWRTFQNAFNRANGGDTVLFADGTYSETPTLSRSGSAGSPITFQAAGTGCILLTGAATGDVWHVTG